MSYFGIFMVSAAAKVTQLFAFIFCYNTTVNATKEKSCTGSDDARKYWIWGSAKRDF